jgi:aminopeptidase N
MSVSLHHSLIRSLRYLIPAHPLRRIAETASLLGLMMGFPMPSMAQQTEGEVFTRADTLRGSNTPQRAWWDVTFYDLNVKIDPTTQSISGYNGITYKVLSSAQEMQIDLMTPLEVDSMVQDGKVLTHRREGNAFFVTLEAKQPVGAQKTITVYYHGKPRVAKNPPWDGGFIWTRDKSGNLWISTAVQGVGASLWWPNKDYQGEEPDSQRIAITVPNPLINISNGRLRRTIQNADSTTTYEWFVSNPINNYDVAVNAGVYSHFSDTLDGENGKLSLDFWALTENLDKAKQQFQQSKPMLACFERWFGPFPWYSDGFKLVETPFLGMEHQSAVAYGNGYVNGYRGRDLSGTGWGLKWDFIIIHESGHEWFGNHITTQDIADMWVHEGFTTYSEVVYTECEFGKEAGADYVIGLRQRIQNDKPVLGVYGVQHEGSSDMYTKGANMLHTIRHIIDDDTKWQAILRGLNATFGRKTVTGRQVQEYINTQSGINFDKVFEQYLSTTKIPVFEYKIVDSTLSYRWRNVVSGFDMPIKVTVAPDTFTVITPKEEWQTMPIRLKSRNDFRVDRNFYVQVRERE